MNAIILFSHGSVLCGAGQNLERIAREMQTSLQERGEAERVVVGYLNYSEPTFEDAFAELVQNGATQITVVPYFLVAGFFVREKLTPKIAQMREQFPDVAVRVAEALLQHPSLAEAIIQCAERAQPPQAWREFWNVAPQFCRANERCPFYGGEHCPAWREMQSAK